MAQHSHLAVGDRVTLTNAEQDVISFVVKEVRSDGMLVNSSGSEFRVGYGAWTVSGVEYTIPQVPGFYVSHTGDEPTMLRLTSSNEWLTADSQELSNDAVVELAPLFHLVTMNAALAKVVALTNYRNSNAARTLSNSYNRGQLDMINGFLEKAVAILRER